MKVLTLPFLFLFLLPFFTEAQPVNIYGTVNQYRPVTEIGCDWVEVTITTAFSPGDRVVLMQMKGADLNQSNTSDFGKVISYQSAGHFEFATVASVSGGKVFFTRLLANTYEVSGLVQLIRVATYTDARVTGALTMPAWAGISGGVLVLEVADSLILNVDISATGKGFQGEFACNNPDGGCGGPYTDYYYAVTSGYGAEKGEGISLIVAGKDGGRGAWANGGGGGNKHNSGGGGGGNFSAGGQGGFEASFCPGADIGGRGGRSLDYTTGRIFLGGGGGSADHNNGVGTSGAKGGGIIIIRCGTLTGNGRLITSDGDDVPVNPNSIGDGAGGGGAGGTILLDVGTFDGTVNVRANGGSGGNQQTTYPACFGTGGGGGTGVMLLTGASLPAAISLTASPGPAGVDIEVSSPCYNTSYGAQPGDNSIGYLLNFPIPEGNDTVVNVYLPADTTLCPGDSLVLSAPSGADSVRWSDGSNASTFTIYSGGSYWLTTYTSACTRTDSITVTVLTTLPDFLGPDRGLCPGDSLLLTAPPAISFLWSTGEITSSISVDTAGTYWVTINNGSCTSADTVVVSNTGGPDFSLGNDTTVCDLAVTELRPDLTGDSWLWSTGDTTDHITVQEAGTYWLQLSQSGCTGRDTITISVIPDSIAAFVPNVFSPNGDGNNDLFCITQDIAFEGYELFLYDRNGKMLFTTRDPLKCWDGRQNGADVPEGVYYLTLTCSSVCDPGSLATLSGTVTVLR